MDVDMRAQRHPTAVAMLRELLDVVPSDTVRGVDAERRRTARVHATIEVLIRDHNGLTLAPARTENLSVAGMRITASMFLQPGSVFRFTFQSRVPCSLLGGVCWSRQTAADRFSAGIQFICVTRNEHRDLERLLSVHGRSE
jgi:hypothetical protein